MSHNLGISPNLSAMENTPELSAAIQLVQNNGRGEYGFYTTLGHIVTKILDMDITFILPDGSEYKPFTTVGEVNTFFCITSNDYAMQPNPFAMDLAIGDIYRIKVAPRITGLIELKKNLMKEFFEQNFWSKVNESDTVDIILSRVDEIEKTSEVTEDICNTLKKCIIQNCIGTEQTLNDWKNMSKKERNAYLYSAINKEQCITDFLIDAIDNPWIDNPNNAYEHILDVLQPQIQKLYLIDSEFLRSLGKARPDQFRNTEYL